MAFTYSGRAARNLPVVARPTTSRWSTCPRRASRDSPPESFLSAERAQPVCRTPPGQHDQRGHRRARQLLRPYPQFGTFAIEEYEGSDRYHGATIQLQKRFRNGNSLTSQYTRSSLRD